MENEQYPEVTPPSSGPPRWLIAVLAGFGLLLVYVVYAQHSARAVLTAQLGQTNEQLSQLQARAETLEDNYADFRAEFEVTSEKLGVTQKDLRRARAQARRIREEQRKTAEQLGTQLEEHQAQLGTLTGEVTEVKEDVEATREQLEQAQLELQRTVGDLGIQSGLIARNHEELEELKRRGERDYFEFDIKKSKQYARVGMVSVRLNKTDTKRQRFTITLLDSDKRIEKKDKTLLEPVQFYLRDTRHLLEFVIYEVDKNRIAGYLSVPKEIAMRR